MQNFSIKQWFATIGITVFVLAGTIYTLTPLQNAARSIASKDGIEELSREVSICEAQLQNAKNTAKETEKNYDVVPDWIFTTASIASMTTGPLFLQYTQGKKGFKNEALQLFFHRLSQMPAGKHLFSEALSSMMIKRPLKYPTKPGCATLLKILSQGGNFRLIQVTTRNLSLIGILTLGTIVATPSYLRLANDSKNKILDPNSTDMWKEATSKIDKKSDFYQQLNNLSQKVDNGDALGIKQQLSKTLALLEDYLEETYQETSQLLSTPPVSNTDKYHLALFEKLYYLRKCKLEKIKFYIQEI